MVTFYFLLLLFHLTITSSQPHSNINSIIDLTNHHNFGGTLQDASSYDYEYNFCISGLLEQKSKGLIFGPFYKFTIEQSATTLPCSPCQYSSPPIISWTKLGFENEVIRLRPNEDYEINSIDNSLLIKNPRPSDFGTYYCTLNGFVAYIWSLEVEPFKYFDILKARHWKSHSITLPQMKVSTKWEPWSACNKCDIVGKRYRVGNCYVKSLESSPSSYKALQLYKTGLSCNLFLLIHPGIDPVTIETLSTKPVLLIGYCKIPCDFLDLPPDVSLSRVHPKIRLVYQNELEMRADLELEKIREKNKGKRAIVPGKPTVTEGLLLFLLIAFQFLIVVHICRNRRRAK